MSDRTQHWIYGGASIGVGIGPTERFRRAIPTNINRGQGGLAMVDNSAMHGTDRTVGMTPVEFGARHWRRGRLLLAAAGALMLAWSPAAAQGINFDLVRSTGAENANCLLDAEGTVSVTPHEEAEVMKIDVKGMPPNTTFDVFVIQLPNGPFGMSWYQGDIQTNSRGVGHAVFLGRFNIETFIVAPGPGPAPVVHTDPFPDAATNPATAPVHTYHVGLWFDSSDAASAAGCPATVTPFNGEHNAGIQALSTKQFPDTQGPLSQLQ